MINWWLIIVIVGTYQLIWKGCSMIGLIAVVIKGMRSNGEELGGQPTKYIIITSLTQSSPQIVASSIIQDSRISPCSIQFIGFLLSDFGALCNITVNYDTTQRW